jgi:hypothetical protein
MWKQREAEMSSEKIDWQARLKAKRSAKFEELYPAQEAALNSYSSKFIETPNIAIELPTGSGKSLIALMILDFWMEQRKRSAVLCGTKNLARQFKDEADALGVETILLEGSKSKWKTTDKFRYTKAKAVAILNYWGYINQSPGVDPADVLVLDDAHLAESAAHSLFALDIGVSKHQLLFRNLIAALAVRFPHSSRIVDCHQDIQTPFATVELLNFTDWLDFVPEFESIMGRATECQHGGDLYFPWNRIRPLLRSSLCFVGSYSITVRPGCYPLTGEEHIRKPTQRILMSATIGTADDLSRRTGISEIKSLPIAPHYRYAVPGKRLLIFPDNEARETDLETLALNLAIKLRRSVWLCASSAEQNDWSEKLSEHIAKAGIVDQPLFVAEAQAEEIDQFMEAEAGHLFTAARYDGMDFEGDICRLVVMPSLPQACGSFERFVSENIGDASFMKSRVLQRMKQALGRATRNDHDWAVYIFLRDSFSQYLTSAESLDEFPSNVQDEIEFGVEVSSRRIEDITKVINGFRSGKLAEIEFPQKPFSFPPATGSDITGVANKEIDFWNKLHITHSFDQAALAAEFAASELQTSQPGYSMFWRYLKALASYLRYSVDGDPLGLANAKNELTRVLDEPRQSAWFSRLNRLRQTLNMEVTPDETDFEEFDCISASWNHLLNGDLRNYKKHQGFFDDLRRALVGNDHKEFCHGVRNLFRILGWEAEIKEKEQGDTDVIAMTSVQGNHYLLIVEGKPEMPDGKSIPLRYVNQVSGQLTRYKADPRFAKHQIAAVLVSKASQLDDSAVPAAGNMTFVLQTSLKAVADLAIAAFQRYAAIRNRRGLLPKRSECVESLHMAPKLLGFFAICSTKGTVLTDEQIVTAMKRE